MNASAGQSRTATHDHRSQRDLDLDLRVGLGIEGYRWVAWNETALAGTPLHEAGRFVGHPGDLLAHLYVDAAPAAPLAAQPYRRLPAYSCDPALAFRAAERAGLFASEGAQLSCTRGGRWSVAVNRAGIDMEDELLARLLCRAALRLLEPVEGG
jgi:hypothetical protein